MRNYKKGIWTIIALEFLFVYLLGAISLKSIVAPFFELGFWLTPIFAIVPSFLLAMLVIVLFYKEGREIKIQFFCQLSGLILMVCLLSYTIGQRIIDQWQYDKATNHLSIEESPKELERALQLVKSQFDSTTKINISSYWVSNEEPEETRNKVASYTIYFTYYLNADSSTEYYSKLVPYNSTYKVEVLNGNPELNAEVINWRQGIDNALQEANKGQSIN